MQITQIDVTPVSVPYREPVRWRFGTMEGVTTAVVRVLTDSGIEGIGEAPGVPSIGMITHALDFFTPSLIGANPLQVRLAMLGARAGGAGDFPHVANVALAALEMAIWDICGKAFDAPVHQLFGGTVSRSIPFYWHVNAPTGSEDDMVADAREGVRQGFTTLYVKGSDHVARDLGIMKALRAAFGDEIELRLDPNEGWRMLECLKHEELLQRVRLEFLEEPFEKGALDDMRELRRRTGVPVGANQSAWLLSDVLNVLQARAADVVVTGLHQAGGLSELDAAAAICRLFGVPLVRHSLCDLGIATAAALQVLSTRPDGGLAHQTHLTLVDHDLLSESFVFDAGRLRVPTGPGLGVSLDLDALDRYARHFQTSGEYRSYDGRQMVRSANHNA